MNCDQGNTIPAHIYLEHKGYKPARMSHDARILWYISPLRAPENTPSFKIDTTMNKWFDHALGRGGTTVDIAVELCKGSVSDALADISKTGLYQPLGNTHSSFTDGLKHLHAVTQKTVAYEKENNWDYAFKLVRSCPIQHPALLQYLDKRKIDREIAKSYLEEIYFSPPDGSKQYFALGWKSGNGFEARNALFKGFVGVGKEITILDVPGASECCLFEGFIDYLSYLSWNNINNPTFSAIILNSTALKAHALKALKSKPYSLVKLFLDNDEAGKIVLNFLTSELSSLNILDMRPSYAGFDDFNDWVVNSNH